MSTSVVPFDRNKLAAALKQTSREAAPAASFLRMDKTGSWAFGVEADEVPADAEFAVNPEGFAHGYVAWGEGEKLGEVIGPVTDAIPETGPVPGGARGWEFQLGMSLKGAPNSVMAGLDLTYRASSVGGKRAIAALSKQIAERLEEGEDALVPVITLGSDSYKHKQYGKIYNPVFEIVRWVKVEQLVEEAAKPKAKAKAPAKALPAKTAAKRK
jgi:hypothetical protein